LQLLEAKRKDCKAEVAGEPEESGDAAAEADGKKIAQLRKDISHLEGIEDAEEVLVRKKKQLQDLLEARRSTKSIDDQIEGLEGFIERKKKALQKQEELVVSHEAQAKVHRDAAAAAQVEADKLTAHLADLEQQRKDLYCKKVPGAVKPAASEGDKVAAFAAAWAALQALLLPKAAELGADVAAACQAMGALCPAEAAARRSAPRIPTPVEAAAGAAADVAGEADVSMDDFTEEGEAESLRKHTEGIREALLKQGISGEAAAAAAAEVAAGLQKEQKEKENERKRRRKDLQ
jgi:hypothetical protein